MKSEENKTREIRSKVNHNRHEFQILINFFVCFCCSPER